MVPKGWQLTTLGQVASIKSGATPLRAKGDRYFTLNGGIPWVKTMDLTNDEIIKTTEQITELAVQETSCSIFPKDTILVAMYGGFNQIGRTGKLTEPSAINQAISALRLLPEATPDYVLQYLNHNVDVWKRFAASSRKDPNITREDVCNFPLLLPPLPEQRKIAQILSTWDKAIATTERLLVNKQQQKKALMQRLLTGKQRFAGFEGEWQIVKLGSVAEMNSGGTPKSTIEDYYGGQIPWVSIADMTSKGKWIDSTDKYLTQMGLDNSSARIYPVNTVLYAMYASIGECSIAKVELASSQAILGIRPSAQLHFEFLYFYLCSLKDKIKLQGQQGTQANLNAGMVKEFLIPLPSINEQRQIASVLCLADNELAIIQLQLENLKQQKKALMQQLLTGKRRVKVDEAAA